MVSCVEDAADSIHRMIAKLQRLIVFTLLAVSLIWGVWSLKTGSPWRAANGALLIVCIYATLLAVEFVLIRLIHGDDPAPRATPRQLLNAWWNEALTAPRVFCWDQPFRSNTLPDRLSAKSAARTVILVHGFLCNRAFWNTWLPRFQAEDVPVLAVNLEPAFGSISDYVQTIEQAVRRAEASTRCAPVLVGHSMGGLAIRAWLATQPDHHRMLRAITIGTPHRGTWLGRFGWSHNSRQMAEGAAWHRNLALTETPERLAQFTCFYSHCDNVVFPASNATLAGAHNWHVPGVAHIQLADQDIVFNEVIRWARQDKPRPAAA
jgi:pimeloyl-ACP methyl ester carboxylesterase